MSERTLLCEIVTPERIVYRNEASMVVAPAVDGEIGILPLHAPLVTVLKAGEIRVIHGEDQVDWLAISGGYMQVHMDKVIILADDAAAASQIDVERARRSKELAEQRLADIAAKVEAEEEAETGAPATAEECIREVAWCEVQLKVGEKKHPR